MKKLFLIALVLVVSSTACAAGSLDISATAARPGDVVTVKLVENGMFAGNIGFGPFLTVSEGTLVPGSFETLTSSFGLSPTIADDGAGGLVVSGPGNYLSIAPMADGSVFKFQFIIPDDWGPDQAITISTTATATYANAPVAWSAAIELIPEPMTVLFLGLGGLFLRRRKR